MITVKEPTPTWQELRAVLANPESTQEQVLQVKLILAKRLANGSNAIHEICNKYHLTPEQAGNLIAQRSSHSIEQEVWAKEEVQGIERSLAKLQGE